MAGSKNLIMGTWTNLPFQGLEQFIASLRRTSFDGDVCVFVDTVPPATVKALMAHGVIVERATRFACRNLAFRLAGITTTRNSLAATEIITKKSSYPTCATSCSSPIRSPRHGPQIWYSRRNAAASAIAKSIRAGLSSVRRGDGRQSALLHDLLLRHHVRHRERNATISGVDDKRTRQSANPDSRRT